ncbi:hypothetical protein BIW11_06939 [Tropilaelaps mercedesae]|uniref:Uncharacterized protein n=1 Tax=Tropilaelaps mercedesae TaxID=418985 RepID=A0A1V9XW29_9ACAR|nr:hypothetical protein BIW11_06939 [Tropilaelaps mercedesae]
MSDSLLDGEPMDQMQLRTVVHYHLADDTTKKAEVQKQDTNLDTYADEPEHNDQDIHVEPENISDEVKHVVESMLSTIVSNENI